MSWATAISRLVLRVLTIALLVDVAFLLLMAVDGSLQDGRFELRYWIFPISFTVGSLSLVPLQILAVRRVDRSAGPADLGRHPTRVVAFPHVDVAELGRLVAAAIRKEPRLQATKGAEALEVTFRGSARAPVAMVHTESVGTGSRAVVTGCGQRVMPADRGRNFALTCAVATAIGKVDAGTP